MELSLKTTIPFRKRTKIEPGETFRVRDGNGRTVETWECVGFGNGKADFKIDGYRDASVI